jgi:hypothetical protein
MHASKIPLRKWLYGMYLVVTARKGISSYQLAKELGITQKSSWFMGHRIRCWIKSSFVDLDGWKNGWFWFGLNGFLRGD